MQLSILPLLASSWLETLWGGSRDSMGVALPSLSPLLHVRPSPPNSPITCAENLTHSRPQQIAVVPGDFCAYTEGSQKDSCFLLSDDLLLGSSGALQCLGLERDRSTNLPSFDQWGFVHPGCWSYVRVRHFKRPWKSPELISGEVRRHRPNDWHS